MMNKVDKILEEVKKLRGKKKDTLKQHPHIVESRKLWGCDAGYDNYDPTTNGKKER